MICFLFVIKVKCYLYEQFCIKRGVCMINLNSISHPSSPQRVDKEPVSKQIKAFEIEMPAVNLEKETTLSGRMIQYFSSAEEFFDKKLPDNTLQKKMDEMGLYLEEKFACFPEFNQWLNTNNEGDWYQKLAMFLVKLPPKAARNVIRLLYDVIHSLLYGMAHPLKATARAGKNLVLLVEELSKPHNWSKMGSSMIGASFGQFLGTGGVNPLSIVGVGIGGALLIAGISVDSLKVVTSAKDETAAMETLQGHVAALPEALMTGFCMGMLLGAIQRGMQVHQKNLYAVTDRSTARVWANKYVAAHHMPPPNQVFWTHSKHVVMQWRHPVHMAGRSRNLWFIKDPASPHFLKLFRNQALTKYGSVGLGASEVAIK
jgi:hypothetical protein